MASGGFRRTSRVWKVWKVDASIIVYGRVIYDLRYKKRGIDAIFRA